MEDEEEKEEEEEEGEEEEKEEEEDLSEVLARSQESEMAGGRVQVQ